MEARGDTDRQIVRYAWRKEAKNESNNLVAACVPRRAGIEQLYQVKRMLGGIGNMLFSTYSQT